MALFEADFREGSRKMPESTEFPEAHTQSRLIELTAEIVAAYVAHHTIRPSDIPELIRTVATSLQMPGKTEAPAMPAPAVPVRRSIVKDHLVCLICGRKQKTLKRHLMTAHSLTPSDYREQFGLNADYPMVAPDYSTRRSEMAKQLGLGRRREPEPEPEPEPVAPPRRRTRRKEAAAAEETS